MRIIAATNRNLQEEIKAGHFREDLFYRLSVFQVHLPSLRERTGDIRILATAFAKSFSEKLSYAVNEMTPAFLEALEQQPWKGNIRELRNVIERSLIVCEGGSWISATFLWKSRTLIMNVRTIVQVVLNWLQWSAGILRVCWNIRKGIKRKLPVC